MGVADGSSVTVVIQAFSGREIVSLKLFTVSPSFLGVRVAGCLSSDLLPTKGVCVARCLCSGRNPVGRVYVSVTREMVLCHYSSVPLWPIAPAQAVALSRNEISSANRCW